MKNIIWIIVDSVRNYTCPAERVDDRGRIELMNSLSKTWIDFKTVVTSAPSTLMSIGAMFTSCPAYYLGANFVDLRIHDCGLPNIGTILKNQGYSTYCITLGPYEREGFGGIVDVVPRSLWPDKAKHRYEWNNYQINETLSNLLANGVREPFFLYVHYNCRGDEHISENVEIGLNNLRNAGLLDNAITLLTSDHGYPDPVRKKEVAKLRREAGLTNEIAHDLVMTDDNILVPLLVNVPGIPSRSIETQICTLDYLPTSLELAGISIPEGMFGTSVVPLILGEEMPDLQERYTRVDGRFLAQTGRVTALRRKDYKYVFFYDRDLSRREEFYCLADDPLEINNLLEGDNITSSIQEKLRKYQEEFDKDQRQAAEFHYRFLCNKFKSQLGRLSINPQSIASISYIPSGINDFDEIFERILVELYVNANLNILSCFDEKGISRCTDEMIIAALPTKTGNRRLLINMKKANANIKLVSDLNLNITPMTPFFILTILRSFWLKRKYYREEPMYFVNDLIATFNQKLGKPVKKL